MVYKRFLLLVTKIFLIKGLIDGGDMRKAELFGHYFLIPLLFVLKMYCIFSCMLDNRSHIVHLI